MRNKYPGDCFRCGKHVPAGEGYFQRKDRRWVVRCMSCVGKGNEPVNIEGRKALEEHHDA